MPHLKDEWFDCPTCAKREHLDNVPECRMCRSRVCPECSGELAWDLEACPEHLNAVVWKIQAERDKLKLAVREFQEEFLKLRQAMGLDQQLGEVLDMTSRKKAPASETLIEEVRRAA